MLYMIDILLGLAALAAGAYCLVLSRRLRALSRIDGSVGGAVAVLSAQVDSLTRTLQSSQEVARAAEARLGEQTARAEAAVRQLELLMASLQDVSDDAPRDAPGAPRPAASVRAHAPQMPSAVAPRAEPRLAGHELAHPEPEIARSRARVLRRRRGLEVAP